MELKRPARVAAIHDMSGFGRCSLTVVLPVLGAMGAECCPLPTAFLSAQTAFQVGPRRFSGHDRSAGTHRQPLAGAGRPI